MNKIISGVLTLFLALTINAQDVTDKKTTHIFERKHEVRLGAVKLLSGGIVEGAYEYIFDENQGFGAYALISLDASSNWFENYSLSPYYRMYFQTNEDYGAKGFFVEGFTSFFSSDNDVFDLNTEETNTEDVFDISIGISLGKKWINTTGFVFEIKGGVGRNLLGNAEDALIKADFYIGYRF